MILVGFWLLLLYEELSFVELQEYDNKIVNVDNTDSKMYFFIIVIFIRKVIHFFRKMKKIKKNYFFSKKCWRYEKKMYLCTRKTTEHGEVGEWLKPTVC